MKKELKIYLRSRDLIQGFLVFLGMTIILITVTGKMETVQMKCMLSFVAGISLSGTIISVIAYLVLKFNIQKEG